MFAEIDIPDKLSELDNDTGFITVNDIPEQSGGFSKTEPIFLYPQTQQNPQNNGDGTWSYSNTLSPEIPASVSSPTQQYVGDTVSKYTKTYTWDMEPDFEISPIDSLSWVMGTMGTNGKSAFVGKLYVDDVLIRETENLVSIPNRNSGFGFIVEFNNIYHTENVKGTVLKVELIYTKTNYNLGYLYGDACINYRYYENVLYYKTSSMQGIGGLAKNINVALYFPEYNTVQFIKNEIQEVRDLANEKIPKYNNYQYHGGGYSSFQTQEFYNYRDHEPIYHLELHIASNNWNFQFSTNDSIEFQIYDQLGFKVNKPFDFKPNKQYIISCACNTVVWSEIQNQ